MRGYSEIANFLKVVGVIIVGKLIPIRISRIAMSSQEYNQSINVITQYYILHKIIFTNVNYITISWLNTLRRRPCSRNLGCRGGEKDGTLFARRKQGWTSWAAGNFGLFFSRLSVCICCRFEISITFQSSSVEENLDLLIFWFFIITDWKTSWIASLLG